MKLSHYCIIFPLDLPLTVISDFQQQTTTLIHQRHQGNIILYHAYCRRKTWRDLIKPGFWSNLCRKINSARRVRRLDLSPLHLLPGERYQLIYQLNQKLSFLAVTIIAQIIFRPEKILLWIFHPRFYPLTLYPKAMYQQHLAILFDCLDYIKLPNPLDDQQLRQNEEKLLRSADLVTANSLGLAHKHTHIRKEVIAVPPGFRSEVYKKFRQYAPLTVRGQLQLIFVGGINYRLDYALLRQLVKRNPQWHFTFVGPVQTEMDNGALDLATAFSPMLKYPNFTHLKLRTPAQLPKLYLQSHLGIIPYSTQIPLNKYCNPLKLMEYFYFGLPVISTPMVFLADYQFPFLRSAPTVADWERTIRQLTLHRPTRADQTAMRRLAMNNSWTHKIDQTVELLEPILTAP